MHTLPKKHHIDRRAESVIETATTVTVDLLSTKETAVWLRTSTQWLEIGRCRGYGPKFQRLSRRQVRYRKADILDWLKERSYASSADYRRQNLA